MPKYLLSYQKTEHVRWLGHLDILRTFERAIRRAAIPIAFSNGFNPRERLVFAQALSTGMTGGAEPALLELTESRRPECILSDLNAVLPDGIRITSCEEMTEAAARAFPGEFDRAVYEVVCDFAPDITLSEVDDTIRAFLQEPHVYVEREREGRVKTVDIRPLVSDLQLMPGPDDPKRFQLEMTLAMGDNGTGKVAEVVRALAERLPGTSMRRAHRARVLRADDREADERRTVPPPDHPAGRNVCLEMTTY